MIDALARFAETRPFSLDPFQAQACRAFEQGSNVLVCAPTGAGKTVVGEFAVSEALRADGKCFYTTPIKALSNQKFADLCDELGDEVVGLITGDTTINPHAPIVVMTTEVLRNMLYAGSPDLAELTAVVLDEVHYLADKFRGAVWEEVLLHLPRRVRVVGLSATVSNAEEFGDWIREVRGETEVIVDEVRPVPLFQHVMVGRRLYDLYADGGSSGREVEPSLRRAVNDASSRGGHAERRDRGARAAGARGRRGGRGGSGGPGRPGGSRWRPTPRPAVVRQLHDAGLLPAIVFIFSRAGCDAAVEQCVRGNVRVVPDENRPRIEAVIARHTEGLAADDLDAAGYESWRAGLLRGIGAHHAGLLPAFKEAVEELFIDGLVTVVFATETLALGINMPARAVVLERLVKFNGEMHADITPGEYTQLTGRAGRRGIDVEGHAVVMWSPEVELQAVSGLASTRTFPLYSSFWPTYNMTVNMVDRYGHVAARELLERSFAQFQTDRAVTRKATAVARDRSRFDELGAQLTCDRGDAVEYAELQSRLSHREKEKSRARTAHRRRVTSDDLAALRRGDVIYVPTGKRSGLAVVLDSRPDRNGAIRPLVATERRWAGRLAASEFDGPVPALGRVKLGKYTEHWKPAVRRDLASTLAASGIRPPRRAGNADAATDPPGGGPQEGDLQGGDLDEGDLQGADPADAHDEIAMLRRAVQTHPVHQCHDRQAHAAAAHERATVASRIEATEERISEQRHSLGAALDGIVALLTECGYVADDRATDPGRVLRRIWGESDMVSAECLRRGVLADLPPTELAGVVSLLVFEARGESGASRRRPLAGRLGAAAEDVADVYDDIAAMEQFHGLALTRPPDSGIAAAVTAWAEGGSLAECLTGAAAGGVELSAGDFVRWCRQVIDLLEQMRRAAPTELIPQAARAVASLRRGVVAMGTQ